MNLLLLLLPAACTAALRTAAVLEVNSSYKLLFISKAGVVASPCRKDFGNVVLADLASAPERVVHGAHNLRKLAGITKRRLAAPCTSAVGRKHRLNASNDLAGAAAVHFHYTGDVPRPSAFLGGARGV